MDSLISAAARALAGGDALRALQHVALREDPPALALRGIAMAQLGELARARELLRRAHDAFAPTHALARARCRVAGAEVSLAMRDFAEAAHGLEAAAATLAARGDHANALHARLVAARSQLLLGRLGAAEQALAAALPQVDQAPPLPRTLAASVRAEIALRRLRLEEARSALSAAQAAAAESGVPALQAEVQALHALLTRPAARRTGGAQAQPLRLDDVVALRDAGALVVDGCRRGVHAGGRWLPLARRPVLFALLRALAEAWPGDAERQALIARAFRTRQPDETHRARLRVELGRLRALLGDAATITATPRGYALGAGAAPDVAVLVPPFEGSEAELLALLADGAAWSTSALALALQASQRTVQRALGELLAAGRVRTIGQGRTRRWLAPAASAFTTILLLPAALPPG